MTISQAAQRNHEQLFPGYVSTLQASDPELVEIFENWAFGEVVEAADMDVRLRLMVQLAALVACHAVGEYRVMLEGALNVGVTPVEVKEIVYQAVPYVGMGKVFDVIHATNDVFRNRGIALPLQAQSTTTPPTRQADGLAIRKRFFGEGTDTMIAQAPKDQRHIQHFLSANCFGDWYTRTGLDLKTRELLTFAMLAALGGCEPQVVAHVGGNLAIGNDRQLLISTLTQLLPFIGYPRTLNAMRMVNEGTSA
jgi:4-carboxymuconolactone decarboxylase